MPVVGRLNRLIRNLRDVLAFVNDLEAKGGQFVSLTKQMDMTTLIGKLVFQMFGALSEYERSLIRERARAAAARARDHLGGRLRAKTVAKFKLAPALLQDNTVPISHICQTVGVSHDTLILLPDSRGGSPSHRAIAS